MATHTYTLTPPVLNDGTGIVQTAGGTAPGGGASIQVVIDDTVATSKRQVLNNLEQLKSAIIRDTWPPSI